MAGIVKMVMFDDDVGDPNRPEVIERNERLAKEEADRRNLTSDGNWGSEKREW